MKFRFLFFALVFLIFSCNQKEEADYIVTGATIFDGTGEDPYVADLVIKGDVILHIGNSEGYKTENVLSGEDFVATPGFIDPHSHGNPLETPEFENFLAQGITTICLGQDGSGPSNRNFSDWFSKVDELKLGVNITTLIGHGTIRRRSGVEDNKAPTSDQLERMIHLLDSGMIAGAYGMSTGLEYIPGYYAKEDELMALARTVGKRDGILMSHNRNEDEYAVNESVRELIRQGVECRVQVSHMKIVYGKGKERAEELLTIIDSARNVGIDVKADVYPWTASHTGIGIVFPDWAKTPNDYEEVKVSRRGELKAYLTERVNYRNGPEATLFGTKPWAGKTLKQVADSLGRDFADVLIDDIGPEGASAAYFVMNEELQERLLQHEFVMLCTDGSPTMRHPRGYASYTKMIEEYVVEKELFPLKEAIKKMTSMPAKTIGLDDRGVLKPGMKADILFFRPTDLKSKANFQDPYQLSEGIEWIFLNGQLVKEREEMKIGSGQLLRNTF